jgi:putative sigma-54 modulation protein
MSRKSKALEFIQEGYNVNVIGRNLAVTDALRDYVLEKVTKLDRFGARIIDIFITMEVQKVDHKIDIVMKVNDTKIKCSANSDNMYASIDKAVDRLGQQLKKYKDKLQNHHMPREDIEDMIVKVFKSSEDELTQDVNLDIEEENNRQLFDQFKPGELVTQEVRKLKTLTVDEALTRFELSGDAFMIFRREEDRKICVVYKRKDGHFGLIEAEGT